MAWLLAAPLQEHVKGVDHAFAQVAGAAGRQQGAQLEGFGDAVLIDIREHVLVPLAAQDDLGVVVVKIDLWRQKSLFISSFSINLSCHALWLNRAPLNMPSSVSKV